MGGCEPRIEVIVVKMQNEKISRVGGQDGVGWGGVGG